jgi:hypothetical protein
LFNIVTLVSTGESAEIRNDQRQSGFHCRLVNHSKHAIPHCVQTYSPQYSTASVGKPAGDIVGVEAVGAGAGGADAFV